MKTFAVHHKKNSENEDHILEFLYDKILNNKTVSLENLTRLFIKDSNEPLPNIIENLVSENLIEHDHNSIRLTEKGKKKAELVVRGHRLAQRLMVDVLGISPENANKTAHFMEHIVDEEVLNALSAFLGYPETSPDGKIIPNPSMKKIFSIKPVICKLSEMEIGSVARIKYIQNPVDLLSQMGILPGEVIKLIQKKPSVIIEMGHTTIAIDANLAQTVFVQPK